MSVAPPTEDRLTNSEIVEMGRGVRTVVLSAKFGGGHKSTADALRHWWESTVPTGTLQVVDYFDEFVSPVRRRCERAPAGVGWTATYRSAGLV